MNVAFDARITQGTIRGMGVYAINLLRALARHPQAPKLTLLLDASKPDPTGVYLNRYHAVRRLSGFGGTIGWEQWAMRGVKGFDLLHCPANAAPTGARVPVVVTVHDAIFMRRSSEISDVRYFSQTVGHWYRTTCYPRGARAAAGVITVSEASKREIITRMGVDPDRITVTPEAASEAFGAVAPTPEADLLPRLGLRRPYFLAMGAYEKRKNVALLFRVWESLTLAGGVIPQLVLSGAENLRATHYQSEVRERGIWPDVKFLPYLSDADLKGLHTYATAFLMPSRQEGFGLPPLEAMTVGTPVVASRIPAHEEVCGNAAVLLDPDDQAAWVTTVKRLSSDPALRDALRAAGPKRAATFSWDRCAEQTLGAYARATDATKSLGR